MKSSLRRQGKKRYAILISLCIVFFAMSLSLKLPLDFVSAEEPNHSVSTAEELEDTVIEQLGKLDLKGLEEYIQSLNDLSNVSITDRFLQYIRGGEFNFENFGKEIKAILFSKITQLLPAFACITAVTLLSGLISTLKSGGGQASTEMIFLITYVAALIPLIGILTEVIQTSQESLRSMKKQMEIVYPLMLTTMAASGGSVSAAVCRPAVAFFSSSIVSVIEKVVFPLTIAVIVFSMAGKLTNQLKIEKFTAFFKSINKWIIGICVSVFGIFFTLQGITAATYDGVVRRAAKYAVSNGIPIVGGFLSGGFDLAVAGGILIKNSLGSMSIFLMLYVLFEPIALLVAVNVLLRLIAAVTQPFGESRISNFLGETAENLHYCTAGLLFTAFLYFLSIMVIIFSTEALF